MIKVLKSGFFSTIQDQGRFGYRNFGVPVSGVMDKYASDFANQILGNEKKSAVLEMTMIGAKLQFLVPTIIAITGGDMNPKINGESVDMYKSIMVSSNAVLSLGYAKSGFRTYVAVKGGFLTDMVLGSRSMLKVITEPFKISDDDILPIAETVELEGTKNAKIRYKDAYLRANSIEVTKGPEFNKLTQQQQDLVLNQNFTVSKYNNRMAYQLLPLVKNNLESILTAPVLPGTVQLTPAGQLIVLMRDSQTTGGYPRVLQLTENAITILGQKTTGSSILIQLKT
ncbi:5-oxoprolinase subunit C family protein [Winogradskyella endarachnes]|uniref:Allophanate hydrolase subunit 2 family protein n=1 Tax=Winogradskyella endarachnes TaxID=2681965 RepID=A0A6L6U4D9_9FLAO|nr:biotin-dependent carboxyltransferase family protein [Winogradskyella endarachnes]MUU76943.1 allophanate hydrolase subunit 2 family protein [Winogradskyella endarachnes]